VDNRALLIQKIHQEGVMLGCDIDKATAVLSPCGMGQLECAVNSACSFKLAVDLDSVSNQKGEIGGDLESLRGEIHEGAQAGGSVAAQEAAPVDGNAKVLAWIGHGRPLFLIDQ
jgi:hypothetical protein